MPFAQEFDPPERVRANRGADLERLRTLLKDTGTAPEIRNRGPAEGGAIPVHECLRPLVPGGELARGTIVAVPPRTAPWPPAAAPTYLALALLAGATAGGAWGAAIGYPALGIAAAAGLGADLSKTLLLDEPGDRWPDAVAILADAVDVILLHPPARPTGEQLRRLTSRVRTTARQRGVALIVTGPWSSAHLTLHTHDPHWTGLGNGTGHLTARRVTVSSDGRAVHGRQREVDLWLPAADGTVADYISAGIEQQRPAEQPWPRLRIA
jgi:hypothetical protein